MKIHAKRFMTADGMRNDQVITLERGVITKIIPGLAGDASYAYVAPGLFDGHHHGAAGFDPFSSSKEQAGRWLQFLAHKGTTRVLLTLRCAEVSATRGALSFIKHLMELQALGRLGGALIMGVHLEGPFINPAKAAPMDEACVQPLSVDAYQTLTDGYADIVRLVTLAPEMEMDGNPLIRHIQACGVKINAGHTDATYIQAAPAFSAGVSGVTHTFNAMRPMHHREGGVLAAAFLHPGVFCELVCNGKFVDVQMLRLAIRLKGPRRILMVSDSASGEDTAQLTDGIRVLAEAGIPTEDAFAMASFTPLRRFGAPAGTQINQSADLSLWAEDLTPIGSIIGTQDFRDEGDGTRNA